MKRNLISQLEYEQAMRWSREFTLVPIKGSEGLFHAPTFEEIFAKFPYLAAGEARKSVQKNKKQRNDARRRRNF